MGRGFGLVFIGFILVQSVGQASENDKGFVELHSVPNSIATDLVSDIFEKFVYLSDAKYDDVEREINSTYLRAVKNTPVKVSNDVARLSVFVDFFLPNICYVFADKREGYPEPKIFLDRLLDGLSDESDAHRTEISRAIQNLNASGENVLSRQTLFLLSMFKLACGERGKFTSVSFGERESFHLEDVLLDLGISKEDYHARVSEYQREYKEYGYVKKSDSEIYDIEKQYQSEGVFLRNYEIVKKALSFQPSTLIEDPTVDFLGSEGVGVQSSSGFSSVVSVYGTSVGKVTVEELDVNTSNSKTFIDSGAFNIKVGKNKAILSVSKGKYSNQFLSHIYWKDLDSRRDFSVQVNLNLNSPSRVSDRNYLLGILSDKFGE